MHLKVSTHKRESGTAAGKVSVETKDVLPNTYDLAQSFLETQPQCDRQALEQSIIDEVKSHGTAVDDSDSDDEDLTYGTGQSLSLPTWVANFLIGVVDRTQVKINNVVFHLDVETALEPNSTIPESLTFGLSVAGIDIEGVTTDNDQDKQDTSTSENQYSNSSREGKRHVSLENVRGFLVSEANLFTLFARSQSIPYSDATHSPVLPQRMSVLREPSDSGHRLSTVMSQDLSASYHSQDPNQDTEEALQIPYDYTDLVSNPDEEQTLSSPSTPRASIHTTSGPPYAQSSPIVTKKARESTTVQEDAQMEHGNSCTVNFRNHFRGRENCGLFSQLTSESPSDESSGAPEDLAQSHVFTHEEAESMYMSALSQISSKTMPGDFEPTEGPTSPGLMSRQVGPEHRDIGHLSSSEALSPSINESGPQTHMRLEGSLKEESSKKDSCAAQDGISTSKGSLLVKEIFCLETISIYIPTYYRESYAPSDSPHSTNLEKSASPHIPGAFSVYSEPARQNLEKVDAGLNPGHVHPPVKDQKIEVELGNLDVKLDLSVGFLIIKVINELLDALKPQDHRKTDRIPPEEQSSPAEPSVITFSLVAEKISLKLMEKLPGISDSASRLFYSNPVSLDSSIVFDATMLGVEAGLDLSKDTIEADLSIGTFKFGHPDEVIMSFDSTDQMQASIRDAFPPKGNDIFVKLRGTGGLIKCEVNTLPLYIRLDLLKLDEAFSSFGGLSSFLNMGSSMSSSNPPTAKSTPKSSAKRVVRFEADEKPNEASKFKMDTRIGSLQLDLVGKDCSMAIRSSAVKIITRDSLIGLGITTARIEGPYRIGTTPLMSILVNGFRLEYLPEPRNTDLERLLNLITPSKLKFDHEYDEIMVDPLLRQRRNGPVLSLSLDSLTTDIKNLAYLDCLPSLGEDLAKIATVAKYLPEDDRPGLLSFIKIGKTLINVNCASRYGNFCVNIEDLDAAHISIPMLAAIAIGKLSIVRNEDEELVGDSGTSARDQISAGAPALMMRYIGSEIDPVVKIKLRDLRVEYRVPTMMEFLNLSADATPQDFEAAMAQSVANFGDQAHAVMVKTGKSPVLSAGKDPSDSKQMKVDMTFRDCLIGLNPLRLKSRMVVALTDAQLTVFLPKDDKMQVDFTITKAGIVLVDDTALLNQLDDAKSTRRRVSDAMSPQIKELCKQGYVNILYTSSAKMNVTVAGVESDEKFVSVEVHDDLLLLETCADSTQTLIALANNLSPPTPPSKAVKFRTSVPLVQDLMASISGEAFGKSEGEYDFEVDFGLNPELLDSVETPGSIESPIDIQSQYLGDNTGAVLFDASASQYSDRTTAQDTHDGVLLSVHESFSGPASALSDGVSDSGSELIIQEDHFGGQSDIGGTAHRWVSSLNKYAIEDKARIQKSPFKISVRDVHAIWNLYDGYDWKSTRDVLTQAVESMEAKAFERRNRMRHASSGEEDPFDDDGTEIGDILFNSIYVALPSTKSPHDIAAAINQQLGDTGTETESIAATTVTATTAPMRAPSRSRSQTRKLKLNRSRRHKITFELQGVCADLVTFPPGSDETQHSLDIRINDLTIFDHVPTSTWKKFATYDRDAGEREMDTHMIHIEMLNVKPVANLAASELVLKVKVLPLRLHVDQDALEFITRFFEFKDDSVEVHSSPSDIPFIQRIDVDDIPVKLDFKPKRVDYMALRSGRTTEFMNFIVLEQSRLVLRHMILYGISGFDRLGTTLNDLWTADVKKNQLPGVLAGLAPARSLVNVGSGFHNLVSVPLREYKKDGRVLRSVRKGAVAFAKTTGTEVVKLGAKLAIGTQYTLQELEDLVANRPPDEFTTWTGDDDDELEEERNKQISLYADQPHNLSQGLSRAMASLSRDLKVAKDAIIAIPTDMAQSRGATGAAKVVLGKAPVLVFRPTIGATKAIGQTLLGATNALDKENRRRAEDVSTGNRQIYVCINFLYVLKIMNLLIFSCRNINTD